MSELVWRDGKKKKQYFTHYYAFDKVFNPQDLKHLAVLLNRQPWQCLISSRPEHQWVRFGLEDFELFKVS